MERAALAEEALVNADSLFDSNLWTCSPLLVPQPSASPQASTQASTQGLSLQVQALTDVINELKNELSSRDEAIFQLQRSQDAASILASELQRCSQAKQEIQQARGQLEQENQMLWVERYIMSQLLGMDAREGNLCGALAAQVHAVKQGKESELHLRCLGEQLKQLAQHDDTPTRGRARQVPSGPGRLLRRSSSSIGLRSVPSSSEGPCLPSPTSPSPTTSGPPAVRSAYSTSDIRTDTSSLVQPARFAEKQARWRTEDRFSIQEEDDLLQLPISGPAAAAADEALEVSPFMRPQPLEVGVGPEHPGMRVGGAHSWSSSERPPEEDVEDVGAWVMEEPQTPMRG